jgi:hypothetical protein
MVCQLWRWAMTWIWDEKEGKWRTEDGSADVWFHHLYGRWFWATGEGVALRVESCDDLDKAKAEAEEALAEASA